MEPSLPRVPGSALMRLWCAKKALASLSQPPPWGGCCQADFSQGDRLLPFTLRSGAGEHRQLCATCTWQHVIKAGAGFGVAQQ